MKHYLVAFFVVLLTFICSIMIYVFEISDGIGRFASVFLAQLLVNTALHFSLCVSKKIKAATLPVLWGLCVIPLYIYCFHLSNQAVSGIFSNGALFAWLAVFILLPVFIVSLLTCSAYLAVRKKRERRLDKA